MWTLLWMISTISSLRLMKCKYSFRSWFFFFKFISVLLYFCYNHVRIYYIFKVCFRGLLTYVCYNVFSNVKQASLFPVIILSKFYYVYIWFENNQRINGLASWHHEAHNFLGLFFFFKLGMHLVWIISNVSDLDIEQVNMSGEGLLFLSFFSLAFHH